MNSSRRGFLKKLGILSVAAAIPESLYKSVEFIEKKATPQFVGHMSIERKRVAVTGGPAEVVWVNDNTYEWDLKKFNEYNSGTKRRAT